MTKIEWAPQCLNEKHNFIRNEKIIFFVRELSDENNDDYKLICDNCREHKNLKAVTEQNTIWCSDCLPPYDEIQWVNATINRNNSDEEIEKVLKKICESDSIIILPWHSKK